MSTIDFDTDKFDRECRDIIEGIKGRFIDLAPLMIDDDQQDYYDQIQRKQDKFRSEFASKLNNLGKEFAYQRAQVTVADADDAADLNELATLDLVLENGMKEISISILQSKNNAKGSTKYKGLI